MTSSGRSKNGGETTYPPTRSNDPKGNANSGVSLTRSSHHSRLRVAAVYRPCMLAFGRFDGQHRGASYLHRAVMTAFRTEIEPRLCRRRAVRTRANYSALTFPLLVLG